MKSALPNLVNPGPDDAAEHDQAGVAFFGYLDELNNVGGGLLLNPGRYEVKCSSPIFGDMNQVVTIEANKVTIIPRGRAMGMTMQLPTDDRYSYSRDFIYNNIAILLGGRVAEVLILNHTTTGAGNDFERATEMARKMVCEWGMSDKLGPLTFGKQEEQIFLGREIAQHRETTIEEVAR